MKTSAYAVAFAALGVVAGLAAVVSIAGLGLLAIAAHADEQLVDLDGHIERMTGGLA